MGAWVVDKGHIQYLVGVIMGMELDWQYNGQTCCIDGDLRNTPEAVGNRLWNSNKNAVAVQIGRASCRERV